MAKKRQMKARGKAKGPKRKESWVSRYVAILVVAFFVVAIGGTIAYFNLAPAGKEATARGLSVTFKGGETRQTLDPSLFAGVKSGPYDVREAYQAAKDIPEVLDELYCYCRCRENFGHRSLLTCYVDRHASECGVCLAQGLKAKELHDDGRDIKEIERLIDEEFGSS